MQWNEMMYYMLYAQIEATDAKLRQVKVGIKIRVTGIKVNRDISDLRSRSGTGTDARRSWT